MSSFHIQRPPRGFLRNATLYLLADITRRVVFSLVAVLMLASSVAFTQAEGGGVCRTCPQARQPSLSSEADAGSCKGKARHEESTR
ncbi:hypothetical protein WDL1P1_00313 (plasmid) [Variovorax sp. WDL1]|nr:hypothetical protein WDL1P1_00313 [Variovorax sp. WDL1]